MIDEEYEDEEPAPIGEDDEFDDEDSDDEDDEDERSAAEPDEAEDEEEEEEGEEREGGRRERDRGSRDRRRYNNAEQLLTEGVPERAARGPAKLREHIGSPLLIKLSGTDKRFVGRWKENGFEIERLSSNLEGDAECTVELSEDCLLRLEAGDLNPQIALVSKQIKVSGRMGSASYFLNLVTPQER